jgi:hypothetical protein
LAICCFSSWRSTDDVYYLLLNGGHKIRALEDGKR